MPFLQTFCCLLTLINFVLIICSGLDTKACKVRGPIICQIMANPGYPREVSKPPLTQSRVNLSPWKAELQLTELSHAHILYEFDNSEI